MNNGAQASTANVITDSILVENQSRRIHLLRSVALIVLAACSVVLLGYFIALFFIPHLPVSLPVVGAMAILSMLAVLVLLTRGRFEPALRLGIVSLTAMWFAAMYFLNGTRGPAILLSPLIMLIAGVIGERRYARPTSIVHIVFYGLCIALESLGVITPYQMTGPASWVAWLACFILAAVIMIMINRQFIAYLGYALSASLKREEALAEMNRLAQASVDAERMAQTQAQENALQLQEVTQEYVTFLERIAAGDYSASLDLSALAARPNLPQELVSLGEYINTTVVSLVSALNEAQNAQRTYMRQSWESLMEAGRMPGGYRYHVDEESQTEHVEIAEDAWLPPMTEAVRSQEVAVRQDELAIPIASGMRAQLIGALGVRRSGQEEWSEDELALVTAVTDQLAQTLENLRLLDETTRRAAREQMSGEITAHIREAVEIEAVLERALSELGGALAADRGAVYLALNEQEKAE
ncbi:MAG TPA: hypothetical protein PLH19_00820 [Anaerolineae bacterium]|nr:hypothetical protein [Anaerolineae bacterium]HQH37062.1 hypothetical protein [Anaerolineae bacterium]